MRRGQRWLTLIFVSVIGVVFVFFLGTGGGLGPATPSGNAIIQLDDVRLTQSDLGRARAAMEERLRAELGDAYDQLGADTYLDGQVLNQLEAPQQRIQALVDPTNGARRERMPAQLLGDRFDLACRHAWTYISASALTSAFSER